MNALRLPMKISSILLFAIALPVCAQWEPFKTPNVPRLANGKLDTAAPVPKTRDGKPDLSGIWQPNGIKYLINIAADLKAPDVPFQPEAETLYKKRIENHGL